MGSNNFFQRSLSLCTSLFSKGAAQQPAKPAAPSEPEAHTLCWSVQQNQDGQAFLRIVVETSQACATKVRREKDTLLVTLNGCRRGKDAVGIPADGEIVEKIDVGQDRERNCLLMIKLLPAETPVETRCFSLAPSGSEESFHIVIDVGNIQAGPDEEDTAFIRGKIIVIDAGHGGADAGVIGVGGFTEKEFTLLVAEQMKAMLEPLGAIIVFTRSGDQAVLERASSPADELQARVNFGDKYFADVFVSLHLKGFYDRSVGGMTTYYDPENEASQRLAESLHFDTVEACGLLDRGVEASELYVVKESRIPAVVLETGFLSNPSEEKLLVNPLFQKRIAGGIVKGLGRYFAPVKAEPEPAVDEAADTGTDEAGEQA